MKTLIAILLVLSVAFSTLADETNTPPQQPLAAPVILGCLVVAVAVTAAIVVIKICSTNDNDKGPVKVVLQKSDDHVNWTPICTNIVTLNGKQPIDVFSDDLKTGPYFYRAMAMR